MGRRPPALLGRDTIFLDEIKTKVNYHYWIFVRYHDNKALGEGHILLWEQMVEIT